MEEGEINQKCASGEREKQKDSDTSSLMVSSPPPSPPLPPSAWENVDSTANNLEVVGELLPRESSSTESRKRRQYIEHNFSICVDPILESGVLNVWPESMPIGPLKSLARKAVLGPSHSLLGLDLWTSIIDPSKKTKPISALSPRCLVVKPY